MTKILALLFISYLSFTSCNHHFNFVKYLPEETLKKLVLGAEAEADSYSEFDIKGLDQYIEFYDKDDLIAALEMLYERNGVIIYNYVYNEVEKMNNTNHLFSLRGSLTNERPFSIDNLSKEEIQELLYKIEKILVRKQIPEDEVLNAGLHYYISNLDEEKLKEFFLQILSEVPAELNDEVRELLR